MKTMIKKIVYSVVGLVGLVGMYNALVINSKSSLSISDLPHLKRIDEIFGVTEPGRQIAGYRSWKKLEPSQNNNQNIEASESEEGLKYGGDSLTGEEVSVSLVEVSHPSKWQGLSGNQFNGTLSTNLKTIENLSVSLPGGENISISFAEIKSNIFEYDHNGQIFSGIVYKADESTYIVKLTNGPLEGTHLRFSSESQVEAPDHAQAELESEAFVPEQDDTSSQKKDLTQI